MRNVFMFSYGDVQIDFAVFCMITNFILEKKTECKCLIHSDSEHVSFQ